MITAGSQVVVISHEDMSWLPLYIAVHSALEALDKQNSGPYSPNEISSKLEWVK